MRLSGLVVAIVLLCGGSVVSAQTAPAPQTVAPLPVATFEVVRTYPHDPAAFSQGLIFHDGHLFESTGRVPSSVRKVRLDDGVVLERDELAPDYFGEGLTELNGKLYSLTWRNETGFVWNPDDLSAPTGTFDYDGEGWGLTDDGERLIVSDGTARLRFLDPETFVEVGAVTVTHGGQPVTLLNELEWIDGEVWANLWMADLIVRIDPASGRVVGIVDLTGLLPASERADPTDDVLNGIAWDEKDRRLFVTGKNWPKLFEIRLAPPV